MLTLKLSQHRYAAFSLLWKITGHELLAGTEALGGKVKGGYCLFMSGPTQVFRK